MFELDEYVYYALQAGASGFLLTDSGPVDRSYEIDRTTTASYSVPLRS